MAAMIYALPLLGLVAGAAADPTSCPGDTPLSCHNNGPVNDTCCFIPTGLLVQTQFWDTAPATGPKDSWTIHGLWPDNCDGTYPSRCDSSRAYTNITEILNANGGEDTLAYMEEYWKDYKGDDESFWEHEWSKHGTCISTLEPKCYSGYSSGEEAADYFARTVELFKGLPTYQWLADEGITPSSGKTYDSNKIKSILEAKHGAKVALGCRGNVLNEVWYYFNVKGSLQSGKFVATEPAGSSKKCSGKVQYKPKGN